MADYRVMVPVNGSRADEEAIKLACSVAKKNKGRVRAVYVIEVKRALPLDTELPLENRRGEEVLDQVEEMAEELGCDIDTELIQAREAGPAVVDEAVERGADLIIMGMEYKKRFGDFDLGKATPYILKNAPCQVWVCREPISKEPTK